MERTLILALALLFSVSVSAMDGGWFKEWYQDGRQQEQRMIQRQEQVQVIEQTRCEKKQGKYQDKLDAALLEDPDSTHYLTRYYKWKLDYWVEKCEEE